MNGKNAKLARKAANDAARQTGNQAAVGIIQALEYARTIELKANALETVVNDFRARSFTGRLRWFLTGR